MDGLDGREERSWSGLKGVFGTIMPERKEKKKEADRDDEIKLSDRRKRKKRARENSRNTKVHSKQKIPLRCRADLFRRGRHHSYHTFRRILQG